MTILLLISILVLSTFLNKVDGSTPEKSEKVVEPVETVAETLNTLDTLQTEADTNDYKFPVFPVVELSETNHVVLKGEINEEMISKAIVDISNVVREGETDEIILYIVSPGGSVLAGNNLIQYMNYLRQRGKTFTCIADQAASMAFSIFQECDNRCVMPSSILMQHQMSVGLRDQYENLKNRIHLLDAINQQSVVRQANRIGITVDEFKRKVVSDWWLYGEESVCDNVADRVIYAGCTPELLAGTKEETIEFFGTTYTIIYSNCPLARAPISVSNSNKDSDKESEKSFMEYLDTLLFKNATIRKFF